MIARPLGLWTVGLSLLVACGGGGPPAGTPARQAAAQAGEEESGAAPTAAPTPAAAGPAGKAPGAPRQTADVPVADSTQLQREVFSYRGAGRDPFLSLLRSSDVRPLVTDIRVTGITYDAAYPARSVAVLRDTAQGKRYTVRAGDELGKLRVKEIRPDAVVVNLDEFGAERQVVLTVKRREQEENP